MDLLSLVRRWQPMPHPGRARPNYLFADLSSNNGANAYNAAAYAKAGHLLIGLKATEGVAYVNPYHRGWTLEAHVARTAVLHYHFVDGTNAVQEARHFWENVKPYWRPGDRLAIDIENPALAKLGTVAQSFLAELDAALSNFSGQRAIGYTFASALPGLHVRSEKWWVASFGDKWPAGRFRRLPNGGTMWSWQFSDGQIGAVGPRGLTGINGRCDVSVLSPPIVGLLKKTLHR